MDFTWQLPLLTESSDGKALATTISELFWDFPYDRLPSNPYVSFFLPPANLFMLLILYVVSKPAVKSFGKTFVSPKSAAFKYAVALHNLGLVVFSAIAAYNGWAITLIHMYNEGFYNTYCDPHGTLWGPTYSFGAWATIFYISKFYEFVDTWILLLKGKEASFLQVYHHIGVAISMWGGILSQSAWLTGIVMINSIIHTLMYTYFFIKTVDPTAEIKIVRYLTMAQIGQFFYLIITSSGVLFMGDSCDTASSRWTLIFFDIYLVGLIYLFSAFAAKKYKKDK